MFDDALWAEVPMSEFVVGAGTLAFVHALVKAGSFARGREAVAPGVGP